MINKVEEIINRDEYTKEEIVFLLKLEKEEKKYLFEKASEIKKKYVGNKVYFRGLIEMMNLCSKDCYYCGIRSSNKNVNRYDISDEEILKAAEYAYKFNYGSIVLQGGEITSNTFSDRIERLLYKIKELSDGKLGITLSLGEQSYDVYKRWFEAGAHRYLLRIETSNKLLYSKLHPNNDLHNYDKRLECLYYLRDIGYQLGTGVMIGLPFQTYEDMAEDLLFMRELDIDMCGMGPYIEHKDTPLYEHRDKLLSLDERFQLTLKMIAILRCMMKDINIASATALQAIDKIGREKGIMVGANIIMPNITPGIYRDYYRLYENKPCVDEEAEDCKTCLEARIKLTGNEIGYGEWGDSKHYNNKKSK